MLKIGITGGIGSGKTTVCRIFEVLGVPVFYADQAAKSVMTEDPLLREALIAEFGNMTYQADGTLNRPYLAGIVFNDQARLSVLNGLVHPAVFRAFDDWLFSQKAPYVIKEAALLFESGSYKFCDKTVLVKSPPELRIARVMDRDRLPEAEIRSRMDKQLSDEEKGLLADYILLNDERRLLVTQVLDLHREFTSELL